MTNLSAHDSRQSDHTRVTFLSGRRFLTLARVFLSLEYSRAERETARSLPLCIGSNVLKQIWIALLVSYAAILRVGAN